jgi:imidazole glycerol-phosphate synthase subunit HisH
LTASACFAYDGKGKQLPFFNMKPLVIDYGAGNLRSVVNALHALGYQPLVSGDADTVSRAEVLILPGVGAAGAAMAELEQRHLTEPIRRHIAAGKPFLGVCLGLQLLLDETEEGGAPCLGVLPGRVRRFPAGLKIPHMGWNQVRQQAAHPVFSGIPDNANFYFVHSYYAAPSRPEAVAGTTDYGVTFCSVVAQGKLVATQFHPEKSGSHGLKIYGNFLRLAEAELC